MILLRIVMHSVCGDVVIISYLASFFQAIPIKHSRREQKSQRAARLRKPEQAASSDVIRFESWWAHHLHRFHIVMTPESRDQSPLVYLSRRSHRLQKSHDWSKLHAITAFRVMQGEGSPCPPQKDQVIQMSKVSYVSACGDVLHRPALEDRNRTARPLRVPAQLLDQS
jgi:hypothetical protein